MMEEREGRSGNRKDGKVSKGREAMEEKERKIQGRNVGNGGGNCSNGGKGEKVRDVKK